MIQPGDTYQCFEVDRESSKANQGVVQRLSERTVESIEQVPEDFVLVQIRYSSINYKDALAASGHPGVARNLPLVPGIDAVGQVIHSKTANWKPGDRVLINTDDFGTAADGGLRQAAWVAEDWLVRAPDNLTDYQIACLGTAGITAAWCVDALIQNQVLESDAPVLITGASGGVGSISTEILASRLDHAVVGVSGKTEAATWLKQLGAADVLPRDEFNDSSSRPLLSARWAGGIDTVGSVGLATLLRSTADGGCVAACGMAAGTDLQMSVYPFILRGVILYGIDCTRYSQPQKEAMWTRLGEYWLPEKVIQQTRTISLKEVPEATASLLDATNTGRMVVDLQN